MFLKIPKNTDKYQWTQHSIYKMKHYGLSPQRVIRVIRNPERTEVGIVENTIAVMQPASIRRDSSSRGKPASKKWSQEIWAMYQLRGSEAISNPPVGGQFPRLPKPGTRGQAISKQIPNSKFEIKNSMDRKIRIISTWRYPGISPKNNPIPEEILREISSII